MKPGRALVLLLLLALPAQAEELPIAMQMKLFSTLTTYVTGFAPADATSAKVLVLHPSDTPTRGAQTLVTALSGLAPIGGSLKIEAKVLPFSSAAKLKEQLASEKPSAVFLAPELDEKQTEAIVEGATGTNVLTISGIEAHVKKGVVLGFSLVEARPRVLIHLKQANKQVVQFKGGLVSHSVVVER